MRAVGVGVLAVALLLAARADAARYTSEQLIESEAAPAPPRPAGPARTNRVRLGVNYTHVGVAATAPQTGVLQCSLAGFGILASGTARVGEQMTRMYRRGIRALRLMIWHADRLDGAQWGLVPTRFGERYAARLRTYLRLARRVGFERVTIAFGPMDENNPLSPTYEPSRFAKNFALIERVRRIVVASRVPYRLDLLNEGAPAIGWPYLEQATAYVRRLWSAYVARHGREDASISATSPGLAGRVRDLLAVLEPDPLWLDVHIYEDAARELPEVAAAAPGLPLTVGETWRGYAQHIAAAWPQLEEVYEWPLEPTSRCAPIVP